MKKLSILLGVILTMSNLSFAQGTVSSGASDVATTYQYNNTGSTKSDFNSNCDSNCISANNVVNILVNNSYSSSVVYNAPGAFVPPTDTPYTPNCSTGTCGGSKAPNAETYPYVLVYCKSSNLITGSQYTTYSNTSWPEGAIAVYNVIYNSTGWTQGTLVKDKLTSTTCSYS
jgi:hypothetical protein